MSHFAAPVWAQYNDRHKAVCNCGWTGEVRPTKEHAQADADEHMAHPETGVSDEAKAVGMAMSYLTGCDAWWSGRLDGVEVVYCPVEPLLAAIRNELELVKQAGKDTPPPQGGS